MNKRGISAGFTLVELLVVIAITVVLLGLVFGPVIQTFNMTRRTNAMVQAQDTARMTLERISREISQAMFIYDNSNCVVNLPVEHPDGTTGVLPVAHCKIDIMLPKLVMHCNHPNHPDTGPRDYDRGDEAWPLCPVCVASDIDIRDDDVEARPRQPLIGDGKLVRYFIGLANPDPTVDPTVVPTPGFRDWQESGSPVNGFILYRAEFDPSDENLFRKDASGRLNLDDPDFFREIAAGDVAPNGRPYWKNWMDIARPVVPQSDIDLVVLKFNNANDPTQITNITSSVRFQLTQMTNDTFAPAFITDERSEAPVAIPTVYRATHGGWGTSYGPNNPIPYEISIIRGNDTWFRTEWDSGGSLVLYKWTKSGGAWNKDGSLAFSVSQFMQTGALNPPQPEVAFRIDPVRGEVRFDIPGSDVIGVDEIKRMNQEISNNWGSGAVRTCRIPMFDTIINADCQFRIVPGSETVTGPDMTPSVPADQIRMVRYERVGLNDVAPGRNQYQIDYGVTDALGERVGWLTFSPALDESIPERLGNGADSRIEVKFRYQCNRDGDIVIGNYATKNLISITLGIRYYDRNSGKVEPVELTNKVRVRNLMR